MLRKLDGSIQLSALRDLVGVCRTLYVDWTCSGADSLDLEELAQIGLELAHALSLARGAAPNTFGDRSARIRAEAASKRLDALLAKTDGIRRTTRAATIRVVREPDAPRLSSE